MIKLLICIMYSLYSPSCLQHRSSQESCEKSGLFEFCHDVKNYGGIIVEINLMESDPKSVEVNTEWSLVPGNHGRPEPVMSGCLLLYISANIGWICYELSH